MGPDVEAGSREAVPTIPVTVRVDHNGRGRWQVTVAPMRKRFVCDTLQDATRVAYESAADASGCELIVHDAYHRVLRRELLK